MDRSDLRSLGNHRILGLFADVLEELNRRGLASSKNNPVADYAEHLVCKAFSLTPARRSAKGFDAAGGDGERYEIKSRRASAGSKPTRFSPIRDLPSRHFDVLVAVLFSQDFTVMRAALIPYDAVLKLAFYQKHVNGWILRIGDGLWSAEGVKDIGAQLRRIQEEEEHPSGGPSGPMDISLG